MVHAPDLARTASEISIDNQRSCTNMCGACGTDAAHPTLVLEGDGVSRDRNDFAYFRCSGCGTLQIAAVPDQLGDYYGRSYYSMRRRERGGRLRNLLMGLRNNYAARGRNVAGGLLHKLWPHPQLWSLRPALDGTLGDRRGKATRILDVGCGAGSMLRDLRLAGFTDLTGIDPFLSQPVEERGFQLLRRELVDHRGTYDVIMFNHSLEHVADPQLTLSAAQDLLAPNGIVIVRVPLVDSEAWRIYGAAWGQLDAPRHLFLFTRRGIGELAKRTGYELVHSCDDSDETQFILSEMRLRDIRFHEVDVKAKMAELFTSAEISEYKVRAAEFNRVGKGDQAAFYLKERAVA